MKNKKQKNKIHAAFGKLKKIYKEIPSTKGCMDHINLPPEQGGCGGWCCQIQAPSLLYVEFLHAWNHILENWIDDDIVNLIEYSISYYIMNPVVKGCIMWDKETKLCRIHEHRPYACRCYGITPDEEFKPRYERLKILYQDTPGAVIRDQCHLVKTEDGTKVTKYMMDDWWEKITQIEQDIGIKKEYIHDNIGGTYRMYHDHIVLQVCTDSLMKKLQFLRINGSQEEKQLAFKVIIKSFREKFKEIKNAFAKRID